MIVHNHQLFSYTYLARLQADTSHDEAATPIAQGLRDWMPFRNTSSLWSLLDSWVGPVLDFLEFHHAPAEDAPHTLLLYARRGDETPIPRPNGTPSTATPPTCSTAYSSSCTPRQRTSREPDIDR